jgi:hypothetical protein
MIVCIIVEQWKCFDTVDARYKHEANINFVMAVRLSVRPKATPQL